MTARTSTPRRRPPTSSAPKPARSSTAAISPARTRSSSSPRSMPRPSTTYTLELSTKQPDPIMPLRMTYVDMGSTTTQEQTDKITKPVGTGPYQFVERIQGQSVKLTRFDGYWGEIPDVKDVTYVYRTEACGARRHDRDGRGPDRHRDPVRGRDRRRPDGHLQGQPHLPDAGHDRQAAVHRPAGAARRLPRHRPRGHHPGADGHHGRALVPDARPAGERLHS